MRAPIINADRSFLEGGWDDDRVAALKKAWLAGSSAAQIARQLGHGCTRNAVIAKVHRLGLSNRARASDPGGDGALKVKAQPHVQPSVVIRSRRKAGAPPPPTPAAIRSVGHRPNPGAVATVPVPPSPLPDEIQTKRPPMLCSIVELRSGQCKWPIGHPKDASFGFCGHRAVQNGQGEFVYCVEHQAVAVASSGGPLAKAKGAQGLERSLRRFI